MISNLPSIKDSSRLDPDTKDLIEQIESAALEAALLILEKLDPARSLSSWRKSDDTLVTEADIESQALLVSLLKDKLPLVCEEDPLSHRLIDQEKNYILIDPLDGTTSARRFGAAIGGQVGYGPIIGLVLNSRLAASVFVNIPSRRGFLAIKGMGCESFSLDGHGSDRQAVMKVPVCPMERSAMLFYAGKHGELEALSVLRKQSALENYYRFGGFANDAVRIAQNLEQIQLQFSVKAWDLPAALIPYEAGCRVVIDPLKEFTDLADYRPRLENPLILGQPALVEEILLILRSSR